MLRKGIRISDTINNNVSVTLKDILDEVPNGDAFKWSIVHLAGTGLFRGKTLQDLEQEIQKLPRGLEIDWNNLHELVGIDPNIEDLELIGCSDEVNLKLYEVEQEMYESCDYTIVFFDSCYWEVFSKDESFIAKLSSKFKDVKFINSDFQNEYK